MPRFNCTLAIKAVSSPATILKIARTVRRRIKAFPKPSRRPVPAASPHAAEALHPERNNNKLSSILPTATEETERRRQIAPTAFNSPRNSSQLLGQPPLGSTTVTFKSRTRPQHPFSIIPSQLR
ncbi:hypothetical protein LZ554_005520 [Drepanopeziza brunnea f. sp. 'monogermtubi']|nr:hypothetical protein LZ554_005520 [Drepanopeziza brunnea f. sp. 'monogermtubi']